MSTKIRNDETNWLKLLSALVVLVAISVGTPANAGSDEGRESVSVHVKNGGREAVSGGVETIDHYNELQTDSGQGKTQASIQSSKQGLAPARSPSFDFWFYEADVLLFSDDDNDGFYYGIDLLFDVDTAYTSADVYAAVYLSLDGGPWNEYAVTEDFTINGTSGSDEYVLVTELMSGYPTGSYDLLIELFDSYDGSYLASFGPEDTSELGYLPLEDFSRDAPVYDAPIARSYGSGGGASGLWMLAMLALLVGARIRRRPAL